MNFNSTIQEVKEKLVQSTQQYKTQADKNRRFKWFEVGDLVIIKIRKKHFPVGTYNKLQLRKMSPFPVLKHINDNAYIIQLPPPLNFPHTFNVSDLYEYKPPDDGQACFLNSRLVPPKWRQPYAASAMEQVVL